MSWALMAGWYANVHLIFPEPSLSTCALGFSDSNLRAETQQWFANVPNSGAQ